MRKVFKLTSMLLVFVITIITASACACKVGNESNTTAVVDLPSTPSFMTLRPMSEDLYFGYLGAKRDFALIIDNEKFTETNKVQNCGESSGIGCASTLTKIVMGYGIKVSLLNGDDSSDNVLMYYTTASSFANYGKTGSTWFGYLTGLVDTKNDTIEANFTDELRNYACNYGSNNSKLDMCIYATEMATKGYSDYAGNAMILFFHQGQLVDILTDKQLDPAGIMDDGTSKIDDLDRMDATGYYSSLIEAMSKRTKVSETSHKSSKGTSTQSLEEIDLGELKEHIEQEDDFLLLVTSKGFIEQKIGTDYYLDGTNNPINIGDMMSLFNNESSYLDNCAIENSAFINFLIQLAEDLFSVAAGAGIGAAIGSVIPGVGTVIGAAAGAVIGFFAGRAAKKEMEEKNNITGDKWCELIKKAFEEVDLNVPVYHYEIGDVQSNLFLYNTPDLKNNKVLNRFGSGYDDIMKYYNTHKDVCDKQAYKVGVPSGALSVLSSIVGDGELNQEYKYADRCEKAVLSNIIGGLDASPQLMLFSEGSRRDDLTGRITGALITETLTIWGLNTIGDMYTMYTSHAANDMSFSVASYQTITDVKGCISEVEIPECSGQTSLTYTNENINGVGTMNFNYTTQFKNMSINKTSSIITDTAINSINLKKSYYRASANADDWQVDYFDMSTEDGSNAYGTLLQDLKDSVKAAPNKYLVKYMNNYYVVSNNKVLLGFKSDSTNIIQVSDVFYYYDVDGTKEYIFTDNGPDQISSLISTIYRTNMMDKVSIQSAFNFYIHVLYTRSIDQQRVSYTRMA